MSSTGETDFYTADEDLPKFIAEFIVGLRKEEEETKIESEMEEMRKDAVQKYGPEKIPIVDNLVLNRLSEIENPIYKSTMEKVIKENPVEKILTEGKEDVVVQKLKLTKGFMAKINEYLDQVVTVAAKEDPSKLDFFRKLSRWVKLTLFKNPEKKLSEESVNRAARLFKSLVPETRSNKIKTLLLLIAGLFTTLGVVIKLHRTHHIIPRKNGHNHHYKKIY